MFKVFSRYVVRAIAWGAAWGALAAFLLATVSFFFPGLLPFSLAVVGVASFLASGLGFTAAGVAPVAIAISSLMGAVVGVILGLAADAAMNKVEIKKRAEKSPIIFSDELGPQCQTGLPPVAPSAAPTQPPLPGQPVAPVSQKQSSDAPAPSSHHTNNNTL